MATWTLLAATGEEKWWLPVAERRSGGFCGPVPLGPRGVSPCFGDVDNDGDLRPLAGAGRGDLFWKTTARATSAGRTAELSRPRPADRLRPAGRRRQRRRSRSCAPCGWPAAIAAGRRGSPGRCSIYNNNRDGSFTDVAGRLGPAMAETPVAAAVYDDFDNDRDLDLVIFPAARAGRSPGSTTALGVQDPRRGRDGLERGLAGQRSRRHHRRPGQGRRSGPARLCTAGERAAVRQRGGFGFRRTQAFAAGSAAGGTGGQFADMDNDGDLDW